MAKTQYQPIGACIYCGATPGNKALTDEHIVPFGLNGNLVLPKASCKLCQGVTRDLENHCLRRMLGPARIHLGLRTRRPKERPKKLGLILEDRQGNQSSTEVKIEQHPLVIPMWKFKPPQLLVGSQENNLASLWLYVKKPIRPVQSSSYISNSAVNAAITMRLLAKISHAFAIAEYGMEAIRPYLIDLIFERGDILASASRFVGSDGDSQNPPGTDSLHDLSLGTELVDGKSLVVAKVRLFSFIGSPVYTVVVGEALNLTISRRAASIDRPQKPDDLVSYIENAA